MGGFSTLRLSWEQIKQKLENEGAKNKAYDSDIDGVFDTGAIPTIPRTKLEYPTENVSFAYLAAINKTRILDEIYRGSVLLTYDSFTDKAIEATVSSKNAHPIHLRVEGRDDFYYLIHYPSASTADHEILKRAGGTETTLATESVDLDGEVGYKYVFSVSGSTLKSFRSGATSPQIIATDTDHASGYFGSGAGRLGYPHANVLSAKLLAPASPAPKALAIIEIDSLKQNLVEISKLDNLPEFLYRDYKKYLILKNKGFTDDEIKELFGNIQTHVDLASVTWGAFDHKPEHNTMLITITARNPYTGDKAIQEQIEHAKSKNLKVLNPPRDYNEAVEQYRQLKQEFTEWIAGKDNFAYQTLGHEDFEKFQVADTYHGNIVEGYRPNAYKNVPDWEIRRTLAMWKERLKRATVVKTEAEKHLKKLEEVEKKGW